MRLNLFIHILLWIGLSRLDQSKTLTVEEIESVFLNEFNRTSVRENLEFLTRNPHVSGSIHNNRLAEHLAELWRNYGFDSVEKSVYEVMLSLPDRQNPNKVQLLDENDDVIYTSKHMETVLRPEDEHEDFISMFNAFSPNGTVEGELMYVNFARPQDFNDLVQLGINLTGKIVIARYGEIFRGNKVNLASQYGALAIILFNDPYQYAQDGEEPDKVYPHSKWLPSSGAQRGSIGTLRGDPQTPQYPSIPHVYRWPTDSVNLPTIPCQPIGYEDAKQMLSRLGGLVVPQNWVGHASSNFRIGPGFLDGNLTKKVRVSVYNRLELTNITNVIGAIKGDVEPDRYVLAGNHRDAWGFGAVDASSGTAQMMEVSRIFSKLLTRGWRPRRTIVFCSWDAEELALIGSFEWVEEKILKLINRAVTYINTDSCAHGEAFIPNASPMLTNFLIDVTKNIPSHANESQSLYETWLEDSIKHGSVDSNGTIKVRGLRGGTDHVPFFAFAGVTSINIAFELDKLKEKRPYSSYPTYHTAYDTFYYVDTFIDPEYRKMKACGQMNLFLLYRLAEANVIPFNMSGYRKDIATAIDDLHRDGVWDLLLNNSVDIAPLEESINSFLEETRNWEKRMLNFNATEPLEIRALNDQLMQLDKAFLKDLGVPLQPHYKHLVKALSLHNMYGSSTFPGIRDLLYEILTHPVDIGSVDPRWVKLQKHISDLIIAFHSAKNFLQPYHIV
ncbi:hypothetical protein CHUAL_012631 [Chamberlinius hualienensis]